MRKPIHGLPKQGKGDGVNIAPKRLHPQREQSKEKGTGAWPMPFHVICGYRQTSAIDVMIRETRP
ncbi:hypothetical protein J2Z50_001805 [Ensifer mexicanus]|nr:hypothetical protein [Sinorhizobium mexicanum]